MNVKAPKIAYVGPDNEFGKVGFQASIARSKLYGLDLHKEVLNFGSIDATTQVLNLKRAKTNIVVINQISSTGAAFLRDARKYGLSGTFIISDVGCDEDTLMLAGMSARGLLGSSNFNPWHVDTSGMIKLRKIVLKYNPKMKVIPRTYIHGWVSGIVLTEGLRKAGRDLDENGLIKAIESIKDFNTNGISGLISYSSDSHKGGEYYRLFKADVEKKRFLSITEWRKPAK